MGRRFIKNFRKYRSGKLEGLGRFLLKNNITANLLTTLGLLSGLAAVYFLFSKYHLFVIFALLHLLFDGLDGVVARLQGPTKFGTYFDMGSDTFVSILVLIKLGWFLNDYYVYIIVGLFIIAIVVHLLSQLTAPIFFMRTVALIVLIVFTFPEGPYMKGLLTFGYLVAGVFTLVSLARQLQWYVTRKR